MTAWKLRLAKKIIRRGGIIAYPTEAVFGLGCDPLNFHAVETLCQLKNRSLSKGLILIASHQDQLRGFVDLTPKQQQKLNTQLALPTTWIVPASKDCPPWLRGQHAGIAVRITHHPLARQLCEHTGLALVSTSANISSRPPAKDALTVRRVFGQSLDLILHADTGHFSQPSQIMDIRTNKRLRRG